ncbi:membrane protein [Rhodopirellula maiorica SM1]|uniref:Membrane protein n=1 Tax=Rhodopirellula maiorica SM1 TaxID=1265738 RepID=M5RT49_9BACT|nr:acyltransferase [Rhodopirellula maiorica]EMI17144.1 membrane protein [Rhodopirellula maiorica SM1]
MRTELSAETKQTFQVVAFLATVFVVAIHYQSAAPSSASLETASANQVVQEFFIGGVARFAVPMFAFAAGFFYFRSDDGSVQTYLRKLRQRCRSVLVPYLATGCIATVCWLLVRTFDGKSTEWSLLDLLATWLLQPPAEQLWFLRDLMVLVIAAPVIRQIVRLPYAAGLSFAGVLWLSHYQPFPIVGGWYLLHTETLFFFCVGCAANQHTEALDRIGRFSTPTVLGFVIVWFDLIVARIMLRPDFDCWYTSDYSVESLLIHKASIICGCFAIWMVAWKVRHPAMIRLSGAAFFVYLIHEFPLRAAMERVMGPMLDKGAWFWVLFPVVTVGCFAAAMLMNRLAPRTIAMLTGGRTPDSAIKLAGTSVRHPVHCADTHPSAATTR